MWRVSEERRNVDDYVVSSAIKHLSAWYFNTNSVFNVYVLIPRDTTNNALDHVANTCDSKYFTYLLTYLLHGAESFLRS